MQTNARTCYHAVEEIRKPHHIPGDHAFLEECARQGLKNAQSRCMPCAATRTGLWCPLGLNALQTRNLDDNAPIQRLATMRLPWRQNTLRF